MNHPEGLEELKYEGVFPWPGAAEEATHAIRLTARNGSRVMAIRVDAPTGTVCAAGVDVRTSASRNSL